MPLGYLWPSLHSSSAIPHQLSVLPNSKVSLVGLSAEVKLTPLIHPISKDSPFNSSLHCQERKYQNGDESMAIPP